MGLGNSNECLGLCVLQAFAEVADSHAGVNHNEDGAGLEQGKRQRKEIEAGLDHQHGSHAAADADAVQSGGDAIALFVQLRKGVMRVADSTAAIAAMREDNRLPARMQPRHRR